MAETTTNSSAEDLAADLSTTQQSPTNHPAQTLSSSQSSSAPSSSLTVTNPSTCSLISSDIPTTPSVVQVPINQSDPSSPISELTHQLEQLSSKLVRSIERIANLEDELHESRRNNEKLSARNAVLELETAKHKQALNSGLLVERAKVQLELQRLTQRVTLESERRSQSEASLSSINQELDDLSASLFTEANRLVATEKLARIKAERKMKEVEEAMKCVEEVIEARRDQSNDMRLSLEAAERDRDHYKAECELLRNQLNIPSDQLTLPNNPTSSIDSLAKSSSIGSISNTRETILTPLLNPLISSRHELGSPMPGHSTPRLAISQIKLSHEILPFTEFVQFVQYLRRAREDALARPPPTPSLTESYYSAAIAMTNIGSTTHPSTPVIQSSNKEATSPSYSKDLASVLPLSQHLSHPFLKRCLDEDSDPALRLDLAPGLNFMSRRPILAALLEGNLVIEPVWSGSDQALGFEKCTLCGCSLSPWLSTGLHSRISTSSQTNKTASNNPSTARSTMRKMLRGGTWGFGGIGKPKRASNPTPPTQPAEHVATSVSLTRTNSGPSTLNNDQGEPLNVHTFRTTDEASTRYPICPTYCLARLRSVCHFWTFVRSLERGVLLDESSRFTHYINYPTAINRFTGAQSLGLAYDCTLKNLREQAQSTDSLHDSPSLTHSDPSSASTSAHTYQSLNHNVISSEIDGHVHAENELESRAATEEFKDFETNNEGKVCPEVPGHSDEPNTRSERPIHNIDVHCDLQPSPLPSPTSTSGHDNDTAHETSQGPTVTILSPPSPLLRTRSLVRSLSPSSNSLPDPPLSAPATSSQIGQHRRDQSHDKSPSSIEFMDPGWEGKCWAQVVKLKEEMFLKRVGISLLTN